MPMRPKRGTAGQTTKAVSLAHLVLKARGAEYQDSVFKAALRTPAADKIVLLLALRPVCMGPATRPPTSARYASWPPRSSGSSSSLATVAQMDDANLPLAVVGMAGAGKSEVSAQLVDFGFQRIYFGQVVLDEIAVRGLPPGADSERTVREGLRQAEGMDVMARRSMPAIRDALDAGHRICIDGLYSGAEWELLARETGLITLAVHAPRWLRKQRAASRQGRPLSAAELDARDLAEVNNLDKATPIALADLHVVNDGTLEQLSASIAALIERLRAATTARLEPPADYLSAAALPRPRPASTHAAARSRSAPP